MISTCWMLGFLVGFLPSMGWYEDTKVGMCFFTRKMTSSYMIFFCFVSVIIPTIIFVVIYARVYQAIHKRVKFNFKSPWHTGGIFFLKYFPSMPWNFIIY